MDHNEKRTSLYGKNAPLVTFEKVIYSVEKWVAHHTHSGYRAKKGVGACDTSSI